MAKRLGLAMPPVQLKKLVHFDIDLPEEIESSATEMEVDAAMLTKGNMLKDLSIPSRTLVIMVRRGEDFFVPTGQSELEVGDQLLVITDNDAALAAQYREAEEQEESNHWGFRLINDTKDFLKERWHHITHPQKTPQPTTPKSNDTQNSQKQPATQQSATPQTADQQSNDQ